MLTKYLTDSCGKKCVFRIIDLSKSLKNRYPISFNMVCTKNAWYILGFQYAIVTHKMTDLFLSKGM